MTLVAPTSTGEPGRQPGASPAAPLGVLTVLVWVAWAAMRGGFPASSFGLLGAFLVLLLAVGIAFVPPDWRAWERRRQVAVASFVLLAGWTYLSMLWADFPSLAWLAGDRTLLYLVGFLVFALWTWTPRMVVVLFGLYAGGVALVGVGVLLALGRSDSPESFFLDSRLVEPVDYANANAALWTMAMWPAVYLGSTRSVPAVARGAACAAAVLLGGLALLAQSRGWLFAMAVAVPLFVLLGRQRARLVLGLAVVAVALALAAPRLLAVFAESRGGLPIGSVADRALLGLLISTLVGFALGLAWALVDARVSLSAGLRRTLVVALAASILAALAVGAVAGARSVSDPGEWLADRWTEFTSGDDPGGGHSSRLAGTAGTNRYAEWRVAWAEFREQPIAGIGADNYLAAYLVRRSDARYEPWFPHSLPLRFLSQLGLVGAGLFLVVGALAAALGLERRRRLDPVAGGAVGAALTIVAYWLVHGTVDWFWEMPALAAPALGFLGLAASVAARGPASARGGPVGWKAVAAAPLVVACVAVLIVPWLWARHYEAGIAAARHDPEQAYERLERAASLNPLSADALVVKAVLALRREEPHVARAALLRAEEREPFNWYVQLQLALTEGALENYERAGTHIARARELNPLEPVVGVVETLVARREKVQPADINAQYEKRLRSRLERGSA